MTRLFTVLEAEQRSEAWRLARTGRLCGSRSADMLATIKSGGEAAGRRNLKAQLVLERLTGRPQDSDYVSPAMQQGIDREADALLLYEALTGQVVIRTGFLSHAALLAGCSLDGHLGDFDGIVEVKCPIPATHLEYLKTGIVPDAYAKQVLHNLWISGAGWCDWLSYNPDFPDPLQVKLVRIPRVPADIDAYAEKAKAFLREVDVEVGALRTQFQLSTVLAEAVA